MGQDERVERHDAAQAVDSRFASNLGPTSANWTSLWDVLAKTWCLVKVSPNEMLHWVR